MKKRIQTLSLVGILVTGGLMLNQSCTKDKTPVDVIVPGECPDTISFSSNIMPVINTNCVACHSPQGGTSPFLTNHGEVSANADKILPTIRWDAGAVKMPDGGPQLSELIVQQFKCWMNQGKLNN